MMKYLRSHCVDDRLQQAMDSITQCQWNGLGSLNLQFWVNAEALLIVLAKKQASADAETPRIMVTSPFLIFILLVSRAPFNDGDGRNRRICFGF
jgi:hypothetical protein